MKTYKSKKNKKIKKFLTCPCCKTDGLDEKHFSIFSEQVEKLSNSKRIFCCGLDLKTSIEEKKVACNNCHKKRIAIKGNPETQLFCDYKPYFSFFDKEFTCQTCKKKSVFSKKEQVFWFQTIKLWVQSYPKNCFECRKEIRSKKKFKKNNNRKHRVSAKYLRSLK